MVSVLDGVRIRDIRLFKSLSLAFLFSPEVLLVATLLVAFIRFRLI